MFSATFPKQIEGLAKKALTRPIEIIIGGRSVATNTVKQHIEVIEANEKFRRLLQLLGEWYEKGMHFSFTS
jgi:ATP-dependent RNA helicase DDX46/PRP5